MKTDWSRLGNVPPQALVGARNLAHHAAQWATKAARANLAAVPDDSHSSLDWNAGLAALQSQPLPAKLGDVRVALRVADLRLMIVQGATAGEAFPLHGKTNVQAGAWIDASLKALGLRPASAVTLPYKLSDHAVVQGAPYDVLSEAEALTELSRWFGAAADAFAQFIAEFSAIKPGAGPVLCWPHHFDIATVVQLEDGHAESAKSIGIGMSPGDEYYAQPYLYISPWPRLDISSLPDLPRPGRWHTEDFIGAVATGEDLLKLENRGPAVVAFVLKVFEVSRARLYS